MVRSWYKVEFWILPEEGVVFPPVPPNEETSYLAALFEFLKTESFIVDDASVTSRLDVGDSGEFRSASSNAREEGGES